MLAAMVQYWDNFALALPAMILLIGSTMERSSTVPVATAGSRGVYRK